MWQRKASTRDIQQCNRSNMGQTVHEIEHLACVLGATAASEMERPDLGEDDNTPRIADLDSVVEFAEE